MPGHWYSSFVSMCLSAFDSGAIGPVGPLAYPTTPQKIEQAKKNKWGVPGYRCGKCGSDKVKVTDGEFGFAAAGDCPGYLLVQCKKGHKSLLPQ
jgi:hypothetical protein